MSPDSHLPSITSRLLKLALPIALARKAINRGKASVLKGRGASLIRHVFYKKMHNGFGLRIQGGRAKKERDYKRSKKGVVGLMLCKCYTWT